MVYPVSSFIRLFFDHGLVVMSFLFHVHVIQGLACAPENALTGTSPRLVGSQHFYTLEYVVYSVTDHNFADRCYVQSVELSSFCLY